MHRPLTAAGIVLLHALGAPSAQAQAGEPRYIEGGFLYCDAVMLGALWDQSVAEARSNLRDKLAHGLETSVQAALISARERGLECAFADTGFSYADAEALAEHWGISVEDAKASLSYKLSAGYIDLAREALEAAHAAEARVVAGAAAYDADDTRARAHYFDSNFLYCDTAMLAAYWGTSVSDAKAIIGRKLLANDGNYLEAQKQSARNDGHRCTFNETPFSFEDAEAVAALWQVDVAQAKAALADKVSLGALDLANDVVVEAHAR